MRVRSPLPVQLWLFLKDAVQGDLGYSCVQKIPVVDLIKERLPVTIELAVAALIFTLIIALPVGIFSAIWQNSLLDRLSMAGSFLGISMPGFWLGIILILLFSVRLHWLPVQGRIAYEDHLVFQTGFFVLDSILTGNRVALVSSIKHLILPGFTLGAAAAAVVACVIRSSMLETLRSDYVVLARSKGVSSWSVIWEKYAQSTLDMLAGMSEALHLQWDEYLTYTIASYLTSSLNNARGVEGCSTWGVNGQISRDGEPMLVKNRDYHPDHQPLQCLARIHPDHGNSFMCLTSAGSPGVFSSGINNTGLAVVDTYISSTDTGPGIARYSLMMDILQNFSTVKEAVTYLPSRPHFGDGSVTVVDAQGDMAVFEIAHSVQAVRQSSQGFVACTNHFTAPETKELWLDREPAHLRGNTQGRLKMIEESLLSAKGKVDIPWSQKFMSTHGDPLSAVCRHAEIDAQSVTTSCVILLPGQASLYVANGIPCQTPFEFVRLAD